MKKANYFCSRPFEWIEVDDKDVYLCNRGLTKAEGFPHKNRSMKEIWNDPRIQDFRKSIFDGTFKYCDKEECPFLIQAEKGEINRWMCLNPVTTYERALQKPRLKQIIEKQLTVLEDGPKTLECCYDGSCNLLCPACRKKRYIAKGFSRLNKIFLQNKIMKEIGFEISMLYVAGAGEALFSKVYRKLLKEVNQKKYPQMKVHLGSNGMYLNEKSWNELTGLNELLDSAYISIDAATKETYERNRCGGDWDVLMQNLEFLSRINKKKNLSFIALGMVVQEDNYHEMPEFVQMAKKFGFNQVLFQKIRPWKGSFLRSSDWEHGAWSRYDYVAIHDEKHPKHQDFLEVLKHPVLEEKQAWLGAFLPLRQKALQQKNDPAYA